MGQSSTVSAPLHKHLAYLVPIRSSYYKNDYLKQSLRSRSDLWRECDNGTSLTPNYFVLNIQHWGQGSVGYGPCSITHPNLALFVTSAHRTFGHMAFPTETIGGKIQLCFYLLSSHRLHLQKRLLFARKNKMFVRGQTSTEDLKYVPVKKKCRTEGLKLWKYWI